MNAFENLTTFFWFDHLDQYAWWLWIKQWYFWLVIKPLLFLFLHGPSISYWGFWKSKDFYEICAHMTHLPKEHFQAHPQICENLIWQDFHSWLTLIHVVLYFYVIYQFIKWGQYILCYSGSFMGRVISKGLARVGKKVTGGVKGNNLKGGSSLGKDLKN